MIARLVVNGLMLRLTVTAADEIEGAGPEDDLDGQLSPHTEASGWLYVCIVVELCWLRCHGWVSFS